MTDLKLELERLINEAVASRLFPAGSIGVITPGQEFTACGGSLTYEDSTPIKPDTLFDTASITKSIPTACLSLKLIEAGRIGLRDDIRQYLPDYQASGDVITIWHLLTHTVYYDFGYRLSSLSGRPAAEILQAIFKVPARVSDSKITYTNSSSILLGLIVEKIYGNSLAAAGAEVFFEPLGMKRSGFEPLELAGRPEIAPTEVTEQRGLIHAEVHDESAHSLLPLATGTAGLFSTAPDLLVFMEMLLNGGALDGHRYLKTQTIEEMGRNQLYGSESSGLGWELDQPRFMGRFAKRAFGKTGFTGCLFLCNPEYKAGLVILSNHVHPKRPDGFEAINRFRRTAADLVFGSISAEALQ